MSFIRGVAAGEVSDELVSVSELSEDAVAEDDSEFVFSPEEGGVDAGAQEQNVSNAAAESTPQKNFLISIEFSFSIHYGNILLTEYHIYCISSTDILLRNGDEYIRECLIYGLGYDIMVKSREKGQCNG